MSRNSPPICAALAIIALALPQLTFAQTRPAPPPPIVDAATIIGDFENDPSSAADHYKLNIILLQGRVVKTNVHSFNGKTFVDLQVTATQKISSPIQIHLAFADTFADQVSKLKVDDIIEVRSSYIENPVIGQKSDISEFFCTQLKLIGHGVAGAVDEKLIAWVRDNNAFGPKTPIVDDMTKTINDELAKDRNFHITFGPGLMKSGKATILGSQDGAMYTLALTDAQATELKVPKLSADVATADTSQARPIEVNMTAFTLDGGGTWQSGKPLTGKVTYEAVRSILKVPGDYGVRLFCAEGGKVLILDSYFAATPLPGDHNTMSFTDTKNILAPGPHFVIFQFVRVLNDTGELQSEQVISAPKPMIIEVKGK